eukprot:66983-Chlamydomonas_euryale.AAC.1
MVGQRFGFWRALAAAPGAGLKELGLCDRVGAVRHVALRRALVEPPPAVGACACVDADVCVSDRHGRGGGSGKGRENQCVGVGVGRVGESSAWVHKGRKGAVERR